MWRKYFFNKQYFEFLHSLESQNPVKTIVHWMLVFTSMTM